MIRNTLAAALLLLAASPLRGDPYPRQTGFRVVNYSFTVLLSDASNELVVTDTVNLAFTAAGVTG
ncbi:MAG TPA: hypothetical protein VN602_05165, partial [Gemmatimonadaceae bacterium]|nr:hypothetical protein [Gemmatimonadaceae bacterium]